MPTFTSDVQAVSSVGGTTIDIRSIGYTDFFKTAQDFRSKVAVEYRDGRSTAYADILNVERISDTVERIYLEAGLPGASNASIKRISFMMPVRFDQDAFELLHLVDEGKAVKTSVVVRSSDLKGMPPIECALTSTIYPIEMLDAMDFTIAITGGSRIGKYVDGLDPTLTVDGGSRIVIVFNDYAEYAPEAVDAVFEIDGGSRLTPVFHDYVEYAPEAVDATMACTGGSRDTTLIRNSMLPEAIDIDFEITGGVRT
jgi:hypothetical protein